MVSYQPKVPAKTKTAQKKFISIQDSFHYWGSGGSGRATILNFIGFTEFPVSPVVKIDRELCVLDQA